MSQLNYIKYKNICKKFIGILNKKKNQLLKKKLEEIQKNLFVKV